MNIINTYTNKPISLLKDIDEDLRDVIVELHKRGMPTQFCCQGKYRAKDSGHMNTSYISFCYPLPQNFQNKVVGMGLFMDGDSIIRSIGNLPKTGMRTLMQVTANRRFANRMKIILGIFEESSK